MRVWKRLMLISGIGILILAIVLLVLAFVFTDFIVDLWWFRSLGYESYFWQRLLYRYLVFILATLLFFIIFFLNFWIASRYLGTTIPIQWQATSNGRSYRQLFRQFREGSLRVYLPVSLILAIIIAYPLFSQWETTLLYVFSRNTDIEDPAFGRDVSYYLFSLPIYLLVLREVFTAFTILLLSLAVLYWLEGKLLFKHGHPFPKGAKIHLSIMVLLISFIIVWGFVLERHQLVYVDRHMPLFYGAGYVEMNIILPLIWASIVLVIGFAFSIVYFIHTRKGLIGLIALAVLFVIMVGMRYTPGITDPVQRYIVAPDELVKERPYITHNIHSTLAAYGLQDVETRPFHLERIPRDITEPQIQEGLRNIPVWDKEVLLDVFKQLQEIQIYYDVNSVDVDRYTINGFYQQVFLAPRELDFSKLPQDAQTWVNQWLNFTHGYGAVMVPAVQAGDQPMTWFLQDIPPQSNYNLTIENPGIYYGLHSYSPVIAPNLSGEVAYPRNDTLVLENYKGQGGVEISSLFRRLVFAAYFREINILLTGQITDRSRILFRRNIIDRIERLTPFFTLDEDPYIVVTSNNLYWIQDAYTHSDWYPYSQPYEGDQPEGDINYIRNSVKIIIDAYNGTVDYYIADPRDPIIQSYNRTYPGVFKDFKQIPETLKPHVRYPKDIFDIQMGIYAKYHQTDPTVFYGQEDRWVFPRIQKKEGIRIVTSYFVTLNLFDRDNFEFMLLVPLNPSRQDNLRSLAVVGCDADNYGRITIFNFPRGILVHGPAQVDAIIDQDPIISQQFTLWERAGSQVERGKMILLPINGIITYIQPVYLEAASAIRIPELRRVIVSQGGIAVMEPSLEASFEALMQRVAAETERPGNGLRTAAESPDAVAEGP